MEQPGVNMLARRVAAFCLLAGAVVPSAAAQGIRTNAPPLTPMLASHVGEDLEAARSTLWDDAQPIVRRAEASDAILARWDQARAATIVMEALSGTITPGSPGACVLEAIARGPSPPREVFRTLADRLSRVENAERAPLLAALSAYRTRECCDLLIDALRNAPDDLSRRQISVALADLSGMDEFGVDADAWAAWLAPLRGLDESQWHQALVGALGARARAQRARADGVEARLVASMRRLHLALSGEARSDLLAELLRESSSALRDLGFDLVERELAANATLGPKVGEAAVAALGASAPHVRARAASLVRQLKPQGAAGAIADALMTENDVRAASSLLLAAQRFALPELVDPALRWADQTGPARGEAFALLWVLTRAGEVPDAQRRERVLQSARAVPGAERTPAVVYLLAFLGDDDDAESLRSMLRADAPDLRLAAAQSLLWDERFADDLLDAATQHQDLFRPACLSQLVHRPTIHGFRRLAALPRPAGEESLLLLADVASALTAPEVLILAEEVESTPLRNALLADLASPARVLQKDTDESTRAAIARGSWLHANRLFRDGRYGDALRALEGVPEVRSVTGTASFNRVYIASLVAFGRSDLAQQSGASADDWLDALESIKGNARVAEGIDAFTKAYNSRLSPEQRQRLESLRKSHPTPPAAGPQ